MFIGNVPLKGNRVSYMSQTGFALRCDWGLHGVTQLAPGSDALVIVDLLSFSTCVAVAVERGATVYPYRWYDTTAGDYAHAVGALLAGPRNAAGYSLSPASLLALPAGTKLVLPSPNGATLSLATGDTPTFAGCLRNASAVARAAQQCGPCVSVIPAGERWPDGSMRFAVEDMIGAGAIIHALAGTRSPEAQAAVSAFLANRDALAAQLADCVSGRELAARGFGGDVALAAALDAGQCAPRLRDGGYG